MTNEPVIIRISEFWLLLFEFDKDVLNSVLVGAVVDPTGLTELSMEKGLFSLYEEVCPVLSSTAIIKNLYV